MAGAGSSSRISLDVPDGRDWRQSSGNNTLTVSGPYTGGLYSTDDPRSSSAQSLVPSLPEYEEFAKRKLLIIYVHGFMGNDTSFQQFPLHVHRYIKDVLAETHVIHSKIYPRYKTYKAIDVARDNFSRWLEPHESPMTDVVLVGHSMGGLLAADVVLMPGQRSQDTYFKHRILGAVHLDSPILGLHPGIVVSGISSLFRPKPEKPGSPEGPGAQLGTAPSEMNVLSPTQSLYSESSFDSQTTMAASSTPGLAGGRTMDPNFDPSFPNDVRLKDRSWWKNVVHFAKKHSSEGLLDATTKHLMSHLEFGGCLMDYSGLKSRYENVRKLEDIDDVKNYGFPHVPPQVRFVQYYTVCHGFPKVPKAPKEEDRPQQMPAQQSLDSIVVADLAEKPDSLRRSVENPVDSTLDVAEIHTIQKESRSPSRGSVSSRSGSELEMLEPEPMPEEEPAAADQKPETTHEQDSTAIGVRSSSSSIVEPPSDVSHPTAKDSGEKTSPSPPRIVKESTTGTLTDLTTATSNLTLDLPAIPEPPTPPTLPDLEKVTDKDARKQAEKESKRLLKAYEQAVKDRNKAIKERDKIIEKRQKKMLQEAEKREKEAQKQARHAEQQRQKDEAEEAKKAAEAKAVSDANEAAQSAAASAAAGMPATTDGQPIQQQSQPALSPPTSPVASPSAPTGGDTSSSPKASESKPKKLKERKFINLPSKVNGQPDPKWVKIFMKDMDETAAHTSLFFLGEHYEKLVGDVGELLTQWVQDDLTKKAVIGYGVD